MQIDSEATQVIQFITALLDNLDVPYVIGGSMASIIHGIIRTTMDVDIVADLKTSQVNEFVLGLNDVFYADEETIRRAIQRQSHFNLIHLETMFKVDIFIPTTRAFDQQQIARRIPEKIETTPPMIWWVLSAEDIVLAKLEWFRKGGEVSERQWRDILGVLKTQGQKLDHAYLREWSQKLHVTDLMERALEQQNQ